VTVNLTLVLRPILFSFITVIIKKLVKQTRIVVMETVNLTFVLRPLLFSFIITVIKYDKQVKANQEL
jgi:hypothetical protein